MQEVVTTLTNFGGTIVVVGLGLWYLVKRDTEQRHIAKETHEQLQSIHRTCEESLRRIHESSMIMVSKNTEVTRELLGEIKGLARHLLSQSQKPVP